MKKKSKSIDKLYGDFIYDSKSIKQSQDLLLNKANQSLREAHADMENLLAKIYSLVENGDGSKSELRKTFHMSKKLSDMVNDFKSNFLR